MWGKDTVVKLYVFLGDILLMYFALFLTLVVRGKSILAVWELNIGDFLYHFSILYVLWAICLFALDFYEIPFFKSIAAFITKLAIFSFAVLFIGMAYFYLRPELVFTPKTILVLNIIIFNVACFCWHLFFNNIIGNFRQRLVIMGSLSHVEKLLPHLDRSSYVVRALFTKYPLEPDIGYVNYHVISQVQELKELLAKEQIDMVVLADDFRVNKSWMGEIFHHVPLEIDFIDWSDFHELLSKRVALEYLDETWFLRKISKGGQKAYAMIKRFIDIVLGLLSLIATIVLFPFIALAIKLDSEGPIFFLQQRVGQHGRIFTAYKFRTMTNRAKEGVIWREKHEGEVTRVGAFLRRFHLDELPQCWSILKGDLSFVGPRPEWSEIAKIYEREIPFYRQRYLVKPGFTGWAQINFRPSQSVQEAKEKFEYDLYYMKNRSLLLDMEVVLKTVRLIFKNKM